MGILEEILRSKEAELPALRRRRLPPPPPRRPAALGRSRGEPLRLLTEIKLKSPSAGPLSRALGVGQRAARYASAGATAVSVLCDGPFFDGAYEHLSEARDACDLPMLCKEFVLDEAQLDAARAFGADLVLLIVRCLAPDRVEALVKASRERELVPLVEVHTPSEAKVALDAGADLVGVNARNLDTLAMNVEGAREILTSLPAGVVRVHLSGIAKPADVLEVAHSTTDAALIGEALMRLDDPAPHLRELVRAAAG